jgi:hypothetical protein
VTRWRAHAYSLGPFVPSETFRRYPREAGRRAAKAATVHGAWSDPPTTRFERHAPFSMDIVSVVRGAWSQQRGSEDIATNAVTPTHASTASRKAGLVP